MTNINVSVCITVKNEEGKIGALLDSLLAQTKKPDEIVIVDGGSTDKTIEIINHYQKKFSGIKLLKEKCIRGRGRNLAVEVARNEIIAMTDAGCIAKPDWLEKVTNPLVHLGGARAHLRGVRMDSSEISVVAGFYKMIAKNEMQKAMRVFLGVMPNKFDINFLPSTRSIAFRKSIWEKVGGFPEDLDAAEDTVFNYKLIKNKARISRVKDAIVEWGTPATIYDLGYKIYEYANGDAKTKTWVFPGKYLSSHNIKALFVVLRYFAGFILLVLSFKSPLFALYLSILISLYLFRSYRKAGLWGIPLQFVADFAVMAGFMTGVVSLRPRAKRGGKQSHFLRDRHARSTRSR